ncbi:nucleoside triphosphate pyrophosphohydrolase [Amylibacter sp.]|nr:nucleoside triphosphate pyrophosphohydrolase [Amylibacter sp.]MDA8757135.1 nucleoside triphosphate pyrophosphohydrolase [Amylibacter sp.]MDA9586433.1 nucleoside triphosphate pyrophosphohydrolase [Amylibacter sp.]MDB2333153.1 nucleoside triphosphate pyrophosphohydrolase [Amylibacter sp.]MDB2524803.1 nucleoside triphosphate pyrophosphohydrolase [Amylibacter sp.]
MTKEKNESQRICVSSNGEISRLLEIMKRLRDPKDGCPWDIEQTYETIAPYTIEEAYEVSDAIDQGNWHELEGELGDLLLQVIYFTQIGSEDGHFSFESVVKNVSDKMIRRHPHVFGDTKQYKSSDQQIRDWEKIKEQERSKNTPSKTLDGIAGNLPALTYATKLQKRAARVGFDWPDISGVTDKISEEIDELNEARNELSLDAQEEEYGDLMFVMVNFARHLKIDPEKALRGANKKFKKRFEQVEKELALIGKTPNQSDLSEMDNLWNIVKQKENNR